MFAYCGNNPVIRIDINGMAWDEVINTIGRWFTRVFGAGATSTATIFKHEQPIVSDPLPITVKTGSETKELVDSTGDSSKFISVYAEGDVSNPLSSSAGLYLNIDKFTLDISLGLDDLSISGKITNRGITSSCGVKANLSEFKVGFENSTTYVSGTRIHETYTNVSVSGIWIVMLYAYLTTGQVIPAST